MSSDSAAGSVPDPEPTVTATVVSQVQAKPLRAVVQPPARWSEVLAVITLVVLADVTLYRGQGYAGFSALFAGGAVLLWLGSYRPKLGVDFWMLAALMSLLAGRLLWQGSWLAVGFGFALLLAYAMVFSGQRPYVLGVVTFLAQVIRGGFDGLLFYAARLAGHRSGRPVPAWLNIGLPVGAVLLFAAIFTAANPDVLTLVSETAKQWAREVRAWLAHFSVFEVLFWLFVLWLSTGLLRPTVHEGGAQQPNGAAQSYSPAAPAPLYAAYRNTLCAVIALFMLYLIFEFRTLWFREFPTGFYYAGYAHEGAAWLTLALALATAILSLIFSGRTLHDPRLATLRRLAWIWSLLNFLLAIAVYHRLLIYIGFNGLTRLRIVGLLGITAVVIGFFLVLWKLTRGQSFAWLVRRQLWTVALMVYLYALLPIDALVVRYNVARIMGGDPKPAVQFAVQPITAEGILLMDPLLSCPDPIIQEGARALLAEADRNAQATINRQEQAGWTAYQIVDHLLAERLSVRRPEWKDYLDRAKWAEAISRFKEYVNQWY